MNLPDLLDKYRVLDRAVRRFAVQPVVVPAGRDLEDPAHRTNTVIGLVHVHEFVDPLDVLSLLPANQAVAFARMSHCCRNCRTWRRSRERSSRSALVSTSLL